MNLKKEKEHIRVSSSMKGKKLVEYRFDDVRTIHDVLNKGLKVSSKNIVLFESDLCLYIV